MKRIQLFLVLSSLIFFTSCINYQYVTLESDLPEEEVTERYFQAEKGVRVTYDFSELNMSIRTRIYNESDSDLFVDLQSSVYTLNNKVVDMVYRGKEVNIRTETTHYEGDPENIFDNSRSITFGKATEIGKPAIVYIPPGTYIQMWGRPYRLNYDENKDFQYTEKEKLYIRGRSYYVKRYDFGDDARTFGISFRVSEEADFANAWNITATFKEKSLYSSKQALAHVPNGDSKHYVTQRGRGGGVVLLGLGAACLFLAVVAADEEPLE